MFGDSVEVVKPPHGPDDLFLPVGIYKAVGRIT